MPKTWISLLVRKLQSYLETIEGAVEAEVRKSQAIVDEINERKRRHRSLLARSVITESEYQSDLSEMEQELKGATSQLNRLANPGDHLKPWIEAAELLNVAQNFVGPGKSHERSEIAKRWSVNSTICDRTVLIQALDPLRVYSTWSQHLTARRE